MRQLRQPEAVIAIVDDDASVQRGLQRLIRSAGWKVETFASAPEFLAMPLSHFHPVIQRWFRERVGEPSPPQVEGWPRIRSGRHTLISWWTCERASQCGT